MIKARYWIQGGWAADHNDGELISTAARKADALNRAKREASLPQHFGWTEVIDTMHHVGRPARVGEFVAE